MLSRFLPQAFDPTRPVAVIAGRGHYPERTVEQIRAHGLPVRLISFEGETRETLVESFPKSERLMIKVGAAGLTIRPSGTIPLLPPRPGIRPDKKH